MTIRTVDHLSADRATDLSVRFRTEDGPVLAVDDVGFTVAEREVLALVGESGCGKSVTAMALTRLLPSQRDSSPARSGSATGRCWSCPSRALRDVRGRDIAYVFQEPMTSLNPVLTVGRQLGEVLRRHRGLRGADRATGARPNCSTWSASRCRPGGCSEYPHQLSGGMRQRVMIAMAVACEPRLLVADEPTTALDVTVQAGILDVLRDLRAEIGTAVLLITHDLGVVADLADRVVVMYAGPHHRGGRHRGAVRPAQPPVHPRAAGGGAGSGAAGRRAAGDPRPGADAALVAGRVHVRRPVRAGRLAVPVAAAGAAARPGRAPGPLRPPAAAAGGVR